MNGDVASHAYVTLKETKIENILSASPILNSIRIAFHWKCGKCNEKVITSGVFREMAVLSMLGS